MENKNERKKNLIKRNLYSTPIMDGKMQPQAVDLEETVLGAIMLEKEALTTVIDILTPESFYKEAHGKIYQAIVNLFNASQPVDILTVTNELKRTSELEIVGGPFYITSLTNRVASGANAEFHARVISEKYIQRELIRVSTHTISESYEDGADVFDLLENSTKSIFEIIDKNVRKQYEKMSALLAQSIKNIEKAGEQEDGITGVPSGFTAIDRVTGGWQKSDLHILAARPGMGKTSFVLTMARNAAIDFKRPIAVFSLEMGALQLVNRLISSETEIPAQKLKKGNLTDQEYVQLIERTVKLGQAPLYIDDTPALSVFELRAKARRLKEQNGIELIIIDYLQLMTVGGTSKGNREQEISLISRSLKALAKEINIPIIALSQLSRDVEKRNSASKRPILSDLRESGAIEQDADMVMFIYRPEYYGLTEDENGNTTKGRAEIIFAKNRNGNPEDVTIRFIGQFTKFTDLDYIEGEAFAGEGTAAATKTYNANSGLEPNSDFITPAPQNTTTNPGISTGNYGKDDDFPF